MLQFIAFARMGRNVFLAYAGVYIDFLRKEENILKEGCYEKDDF